MARVLVAVTTHAARVFGAGLGAVIGLELVARHPHRVSTLVAFEPSLPTLLDVDAPTSIGPTRHVVGDYVIDSVALRASHVPILPAAGRSSRGSWTHRAAEVLARRLALAADRVPGRRRRLRHAAGQVRGAARGDAARRLAPGRDRMTAFAAD